MKRRLAVCATSFAIAAAPAMLLTTNAMASYIPPLPMKACHEPIVMPTPVGILIYDPCVLIPPLP